MKLTKFFFALVFMLLLSTKTFSQELQIGQYFPDYTIHNVLNYKSNQLNLKELRGKLVILDFWAFYCSACLERFRDIDSIQKEFNDKIQIFLVNRENSQQTKKFFLTHTRLKVPEKIAFITTDTLLNNIFPHDGVPFYVWIDGLGKIRYMTHESFSRETIRKYLGNQTLDLPRSNGQIYISSLFNKSFESSIQYATYISRNIDSVYVHIDYNNDNIPYNCQTITDLYQFAYNESDNDGFFKFREPGRTILNVQDTVKYNYSSNMSHDTWRSLYGYYYHAILPEWLRKDKYKIMQGDLQRYFNLDVKIEKREVQCLALIKTSSNDKLKTKGGEPNQTAFSIDLRIKDNDPEHPPIRAIQNKPFQNLFDIIEGYGFSQFKIKIVDSTGYNENIDFAMKEEILNNLTIEKLRNELKRYDLDLIKKNILMDVLVLSEKR